MPSTQIENDFDITTAFELKNSFDQLQVDLLTFYTEAIDLQKMIWWSLLSKHEEKCSRSGSMFLSLVCREFQCYCRLYVTWRWLETALVFLCSDLRYLIGTSRKWRFLFHFILSWLVGRCEEKWLTFSFFLVKDVCMIICFLCIIL